MMFLRTYQQLVMIAFPFRTQRIECNLAMSVGLQDRHTGMPLPGVLSTTVINFSSQGACLILSTLAINGKHLFYETLNSDSYNLLLCFEAQDDVEAEFTIAARSVWMDSCHYMDKPAFKIGIHFLDTQKKLYTIFKRHPPS
jgi:hypothetical protein